MHYSVCRICRRPKSQHTAEERKACSLKTKEETKDEIREPKETRVVIPDPLNDRAAGRMRW